MKPPRPASFPEARCGHAFGFSCKVPTLRAKRSAMRPSRQLRQVHALQFRGDLIDGRGKNSHRSSRALCRPPFCLRFTHIELEIWRTLGQHLFSFSFSIVNCACQFAFRIHTADQFTRRRARADLQATGQKPLQPAWPRSRPDHDQVGGVQPVSVQMKFPVRAIFSSALLFLDLPVHVRQAFDFHHARDAPPSIQSNALSKISGLVQPAPSNRFAKAILPFHRRERLFPFHFAIAAADHSFPAMIQLAPNAQIIQKISTC